LKVLSNLNQSLNLGGSGESRNEQNIQQKHTFSKKIDQTVAAVAMSAQNCNYIDLMNTDGNSLYSSIPTARDLI
jgi:hypothetical protein